MRYIVVEPPIDSIVDFITIDQFKTQVGVTHDAFNDKIKAIIMASYIWAEELTGRVFLPQTICACAPSWKEASDIKKTPMREIEAVHYYTESSSPLEALEDNQYRQVQSGELGGEIEFYTTPPLHHCADAVQVTYKAGYSSIDNIPADVKEAIMLYGSDLFHNRINRADMKITLAESILKRIKCQRV